MSPPLRSYLRVFSLSIFSTYVLALLLITLAIGLPPCMQLITLQPVILQLIKLKDLRQL